MVGSLVVSRTLKGKRQGCCSRRKRGRAPLIAEVETPLASGLPFDAVK